MGDRGNRSLLPAVTLLVLLLVSLRGAIGLAAPLAQGCQPRPSVGVSTVLAGRVSLIPTDSRRLEVTITAQTSSGMPSNRIVALRFGSTPNARIEIPGAPPQVMPNTTYTPPSETA